MHRPESIRWFVTGVSQVIALVFLHGLAQDGNRAAASAAERTFRSTPVARRTIYHSPQTPGYTCWVGAWTMPDNSLMVTFKQATGPLAGRPRSELLEKMGLANLEPGRDFTGLTLSNVYLRSTDGGTTWTKVAEEPFPGPLDRPSWGGSHVALRSGDILRAIDGSQLPLVPELPRRIFFQRSSDLGKTWSQPIIPPEPRRPVADYLGDFGDCISRVRRLADGRLMASGVIRTNAKNRRMGEPLVMFSSNEGQSWEPQPIELSAMQQREGAWNEWDFAELGDGRFLCVFRRNDPEDRAKQVRWQGILAQHEGRWRVDDYAPAPLEHSGHPELLAAREGIVLHLATTGTHWTGDKGRTWHVLTIPDQDTSYRSRYYPRSLQTADGKIFVFGHLGSDNAYGQRDQSIVMDSFELVAE
jgi:hypothetical protein